MAVKVHVILHHFSQYFALKNTTSPGDNQGGKGYWCSHHGQTEANTQCVKAVKKANQVLSQMARGLHFGDKYTWIRLYQQYYHPHLDYCAQAWSPWTRPYINLLESVQE